MCMLCAAYACCNGAANARVGVKIMPPNSLKFEPYAFAKRDWRVDLVIPLQKIKLAYSFGRLLPEYSRMNIHERRKLLSNYPFAGIFVAIFQV